VPEVIDDGVTGCVVPGEAEAVEAIGRLSELDRRKVRIQFEKRFTATRMAQKYLRQYEALVHPNVPEIQAGTRTILPAASDVTRPHQGRE
jgi:glycosyltransferase involved in cell wall biosynthesis